MLRRGSYTLARAMSKQKKETISWESEMKKAEKEGHGRFERTETAYRDEVTTVEKGRYVVYGSHACPW